MLSFVMLVIGFVLLVWGADKFVAGASALARRLGVSPLLVGLTIVAFGTSMPELAVSVTAALRGANEIAVGNVVGSNVFNLLVVAGLSAVICPLVMDKTLLRRDWPLSILATVLAGFASNYVRYVRNKKANVPCSESAAKAILNPQDGFTPRKIFDALEAGGRGSISVAVACGIAGIICGCITATGLASKAINFIFSISKTSTLLALFMTMICCIVLGMGVPTTANYCIMASTCAPILIKMGIPTIAAHFFVFYFGIVADITPPVALAAYAGSAISKGNPMKTGVIATRLAIAAFIIPYVFAFSPSMLFIDTVWYEVVQIGLSSVVGMYGIASALSGFMFKKMSWLERLVAAGGGLLLIIPGLVSDLCGVGLVGAVIAMQLIGRKKEQAARA